jgi:hypothetical protein
MWIASLVKHNMAIYYRMTESVLDFAYKSG